MIVFKSKAHVLALLREKLTASYILDLMIIDKRNWIADQNRCIACIARKLHFPVIVRSNALDEDKAGESQAGRYLSVPNVRTAKQLARAVSDVFASYNGEESENDTVLIQPYIESVKMSGVLMSSIGGSANDYIVLEYSEGSSTSDVTGGTIIPSSITYNPQNGAGLLSSNFARINNAFLEITHYTSNKNLEI